jgi:hypothetical protein
MDRLSMADVTAPGAPGGGFRARRADDRGCRRRGSGFAPDVSAWRGVRGRRWRSGEAEPAADGDGEDGQGHGGDAFGLTSAAVVLAAGGRDQELVLY